VSHPTFFFASIRAINQSRRSLRTASASSSTSASTIPPVSTTASETGGIGSVKTPSSMFAPAAIAARSASVGSHTEKISPGPSRRQGRSATSGVGPT
jgi:hypothetical protein